MDSGKWNGFNKKEFEFEGRHAIIVFPKEAEEKPEEPPKEYVTKAEFEDYQKQMVASINKLKTFIINDSAPTPVVSSKPAPVAVKEKDGEE